MDITGIHKAQISVVLLNKQHFTSDKQGIKYKFKFGYIEEPLEIITFRVPHSLGAISQYDKEGILIQYFSSIKEAATQTNISVDCIRYCIRGQTKTAGKFVWKLINKTGDNNVKSS